MIPLVSSGGEGEKSEGILEIAILAHGAVVGQVSSEVPG